MNSISLWKLLIMELTEDQQKGLNMMSKVLSKEYPYITGTIINLEDFKSYSTLITLKLIINKSKLEEYFKQKLDYRWKEFWRFSNLFYPNPDPDDLITEEIKRLGKMFYGSIGDEYQFESGSISTDKFRQVKINSFILDDEN
jgi:hypothetical protein